MVNIQRLSECTFEQATQAWNRGFEGYFVNIEFTVDRFTTRLGMEGLSPELSVIAFVEGEPAGLVLNGVRIIDGKKVAWNGGTGVATKFRRLGVGKALMKATLDIYREEGVDIATLEAFSSNEKAIALYQQVGYEVIDRLLFLEVTGTFETNPLASHHGETRYQLLRGAPQDVQVLSFYRGMVPWQTQWVGIRDGESLIVRDSAGKTVGYALYKRTFDNAGKLVSIILYQCEADPDREDGDDIVKFALANVFSPYNLACKRTTFNMPASNDRVIRILKEAGFRPAFSSSKIPMEQVYMVRQMEK